MRNLTILSIAMVLGAFVGGCSSGEDVACDISVATLHTCAAYSGLNGDQASAAKSQCVSPGKLVDSCPTKDSVGSCEMTGGGISYAVTYYATTGIDATSAETACKAASGTWSK